MATIYFPSCKFTAYSPKSSKKIQDYLSEKFNFQIGSCCRPGHKKLKKEDEVIYICNTCAAFCKEDSAAEKITSVWELLADDEQFLFPDYSRQKITIQDCWRTYDNISHQKAVRKILQKMNIDIVELKENYDKTRFCGMTLYQPLPKENGEFAPVRFIENASEFFHPHPEEEQIALMKKHCETIETDEVICYCPGCISGINHGGKKGVHLLDLMFGKC